MKLEDFENEFDQDEAAAKSWIEKHPGVVLWIVIGLVALGFAWVVF